jgi:hypothetical protein
MSIETRDRMRAGVLSRMERAERNLRLGIMGAVLVEMGLFALAILMVDWNARLERLIFVFAVLSYTIIVLAVAALGAHVSRSVGRVMMLLDDPSQS